MNKYLARDSGGYTYEQPSRNNCSVAGCFPEKLRWCLIEQVCQGSKAQSALNNPENGILLYVRTFKKWFAFRCTLMILNLSRMRRNVIRDSLRRPENCKRDSALRTCWRFRVFRVAYHIRNDDLL